MANIYSLDLERGSSQLANHADNASLSITGDMTIECWIKPESLNNQMVLVSKYRDGTQNQRSYYLDTNASGGIRFIANQTGAGGGEGGNDHVFTCNTNPIVAGSWQHVAVSIDVSEETVVMYYNVGVVANTHTVDPGTLGTIFDSTAPFVVGANATNAAEWTNFYDGLIDDVRLWNDIRTGAEILQNYQRELNGNEANLSGYWKLNNDYTDVTVNANTLTDVATPVFSTVIPFTGFAPRVILF